MSLTFEHPWFRFANTFSFLLKLSRSIFIDTHATLSVQVERLSTQFFALDANENSHKIEKGFRSNIDLY